MTRLHELREAKGWSFRQVGLEADIEHKQYEGYEKGENIPGFFVLCRIADAYGISVSELLKGVHPVP
ncbi:helix-turn-helix domain-containing protein [Chitinophaga niabensis]|nr:helix-turn-helix transcriptional regulator [Chitinophaga niabensis]